MTTAPDNPSGLSELDRPNSYIGKTVPRPNIERLTQGRGMAERNEARVRQAREELRQVVGFSAADELEKLGRLKAAGTISEQEYATLRARVVQ